jgi:hypothetical protein
MTNEDHEQLLAAVGRAVDWIGAKDFALHEARLTHGVGSLDYAVAIGLYAQVAYIGQRHLIERGQLRNIMAGSIMSLATFVSLACAHPMIKIPKSMPYDKSQLWLAWATAEPEKVNAALDKVLDLLGENSGVVKLDGELADLLASPRFSPASHGDA